MKRIVDMYTSEDVSPEEVFGRILAEGRGTAEGHLEQLESEVKLHGCMLRFFYSKLSDVDKVEFIIPTVVGTLRRINDSMNYDEAILHMRNNPNQPYPLCSCGAESVLKNGKFGPFFSCSAFGNVEDCTQERHKGDTCAFGDWLEYTDGSTEHVLMRDVPRSFQTSTGPKPQLKATTILGTNIRKNKIKELKEEVFKLNAGDSQPTRGAVLKVIYDMLTILEEM